MNEKDWVGEAKSRISVLLQCMYVSRTHTKSMRGRRLSYRLSLNIQEQFLVRANHIFYSNFQGHIKDQDLLLPASQERIVLPSYQVIWNWGKFKYWICYSRQWWLGGVLETIIEAVQIFLTLLRPPGPSRSYKYHDILVIIICVLLRKLLIKIDPCSWTRCVYALTQEETEATTDKSETRTC